MQNFDIIARDNYIQSCHMREGGGSRSVVNLLRTMLFSLELGIVILLYT